MWEAHERDRMRHVQAVLAGTIDRMHTEGLHAAAALHRGDIAAGIRSFAGEWNADLIVMGSHGAGAGEHDLFGSVAAWVSRGAPCPVLVTRSDQEDLVPTNGRFTAPLVAVDYSRFSAPLLRLAADLTEPGVPVQLLHVVRPPGLDLEVSSGLEQPVIDEAMERECERARQRLQRFGEGVSLPDHAVCVAVEVGRAAPTLTAYTERNGNDVIVVGAHSRETGIELLIGTVADRVLRSAALPVLLVPEVALRTGGS